MGRSICKRIQVPEKFQFCIISIIRRQNMSKIKTFQLLSHLSSLSVTRSVWYHILWYGCLVAWLHGCLVAWLHGCMVAWLFGCLVAWFHGCLVSWLHGWLVAWLLGFMVDWLHGCLVSWLHGLHGCMVAWLPGCFFSTLLVHFLGCLFFILHTKLHHFQQFSSFSAFKCPSIWPKPILQKKCYFE